MISKKPAAVVAALAITLTSAVPSLTVAQQAVAAGLGDAAQVTQKASAERSETVKKSEAASLLESLGAAGEGMEWSWVTDTEATTAKEPCWQTSDGQQFDTEEGAQAHADEMALTVEETEAEVPFWKTSDGQEFSDKAAAERHADSTRLGIEELSRKEARWQTSDGKQFMTEEEAKAHVAASTLTFGKVSVDVPYWKTSDGKEFANKEEADAHADSTRLEVSEQKVERQAWKTSDGKTFATEAAAQAHVQEAGAWVEEIRGTVTKVMCSACGATFDSPEAWAIHDIDTHDDGSSYSVITQEGAVGAVSHDKPWGESWRPVARWRTSDGKSFSTAAEAKVHADANRLTYEAVSGSKTTWHTSDGKAFASEAEAKRWCADNSVTVKGSTTTWSTSDGKTFASQAEAEAHATAATPTYQLLEEYVCNADGCGETFDDVLAAAEHFNAHPEGGHDYSIVTYAKTSDGAKLYGQGAQTPEEEAKAYCAAHAVTVAGSKTTWHTSDGKGFATQADAEAHSRYLTYEAKAEPTASWRTSDGKTFASEAEAKKWCATHPVTWEQVTERETVWSTSDGKVFATEAEAEAHGKTLWLTTSPTTVEASVWRTSDGQEFESKAEANAHADSTRLGIEELSRKEARWQTSDGKQFMTEEEVRAHVAASELTFGKVSVDVPYWKTSDGKEFTDKAAAEKHADSTRLGIEELTRKEPRWETSDGKSLASKKEAEAHVAEAALTVSQGEREVEVEETGHYELVESAAQDEEDTNKGDHLDEGAGETDSSASDAKHLSKDNGTPEMGDATTLAAMPTALMGAGALVAALRARRKSR